MPKASKNNASQAEMEQINAVPEAFKSPPKGSKMPLNGSENGFHAGLRVEYRPLESLVPYARNPRTHSDEQVSQIAASIREFGFTNPILIDENKGIIAGHGRLAAARVLRLEKVPCIDLSHLSEEQKRAYIIADNKLALNAGWNEELLRLELTDLKELGSNLQLIGFDAMELADIMLGKDIEFKEYDESAADDVQLVTCPQCGHSFPK
jgi:ParB-like chromosome segregation protein Spo0J